MRVPALSEMFSRPSERGSEWLIWNKGNQDPQNRERSRELVKSAKKLRGLCKDRQKISLLGVAIIILYIKGG